MINAMINARNNRSATRRLRLGLLLLCLAAGAAPALAQDEGEAGEPVRPPPVETPEGSRAWLYYLIGAAGAAAAVGVAIMPSKRTHQD